MPCPGGKGAERWWWRLWWCVWERGARGSTLFSASDPPSQKPALPAPRPEQQSACRPASLPFNCIPLHPTPSKPTQPTPVRPILPQPIHPSPPHLTTQVTRLSHRPLAILARVLAAGEGGQREKAEGAGKVSQMLCAWWQTVTQAITASARPAFRHSPMQKQPVCNLPPQRHTDTPPTATYPIAVQSPVHQPSAAAQCAQQRRPPPATAATRPHRLCMDGGAES